ncbi:porin [Cupriavidus basilensis]|uniref:Outer membrane protein (Porin) n=1 Tax=Cupriavidus basilensis TaxID=68895 RepID=A0A0C4YKP5_9BURK|nr:porin [Cupriavidus basilensis]AJG21186.1 Outer membrane protein (porin) [Cupriavidus basilensis]
MKMKLFAAAVAALAAGGAYAQSSVTLYGVVDAGISYNNKANAAGDNLYRMTSGNQSGSRWGLRGVEDLGGGLKGIFVLESGFNTDTGGQADSSRLFNRNAYVGLQNQWGTVTLGRQQTLMYDFGLAYDPMAISTRYSITSTAAEFAQRADNAVKYVGTFGGLTVAGLYSFTNNGQEVAGQFRSGREYSVSASYAAGPFSVGAFYDQTNNTGADAANAALIRRASVAGTYAFGPAKVYAGYRYAHAFNGASLVGASALNAAGVSTALTNSASSVYWAGLGYQLTPAFSLTGAVYYQDFRQTSADPWQFVATADYALSKRTDLYTSLSYVKNKNGSSLGVDGFNTSSTTNVQQGANQFGATVGIRHKF